MARRREAGNAPLAYLYKPDGARDTEPSHSVCPSFYSTMKFIPVNASSAGGDDSELHTIARDTGIPVIAHWLDPGHVASPLGYSGSLAAAKEEGKVAGGHAPALSVQRLVLPRLHNGRLHAAEGPQRRARGRTWPMRCGGVTSTRSWRWWH